MNKKITRLMAALALLTLLIPFSGWGQAPASITIDPDFLTLDAGEHYGDDNLPITYENIIVENGRSFRFQFYTAEGEETETQTLQMPGNIVAHYATTSPWFRAMVTPQTGNDGFQVSFATMDNGGEARSVYFKLYAYDADSTAVYSNFATVTQAAPGAPGYDVYYKDIAGYGQPENGNYYLIASPIDDAVPIAAGMITDGLGAQATPETSTYDFYWFDQTQADEWRNYRQGTFKLASGMGYLYANKENKTIHFTGTPYTGNGEIALTYDESADFAGWNLIGNPFATAATLNKPYYRMNSGGSALETTTENTAIAAMEGVFVKATEAGQTAQFAQSRGGSQAIAKAEISVIGNRGTVVDNAIVRFDNGETLEKFIFGNPAANIYFAQDGKEYAIVRSNAQGEMPVNFKAQNNGTYTISINLENVEMNYLHLIDNMTGTDVDLLANPSYTFEAKTTDYASRFRLVFNVTGVEENTTCTEPFAFFNGSEWVVSNMGEATLQVVDMLGRIVSSETVNGNATINLNQTPGVYMLRLVNGENVMVQKVVVR